MRDSVTSTRLLLPPLRLRMAFVTVPPRIAGVPDPVPTSSPEGAAPSDPADDAVLEPTPAEAEPTDESPEAQPTQAGSAKDAAADAPEDAAAHTSEDTADDTPADTSDDTPADPAADALPTEAELLRTAVPATVRRAPRYGAFMTAGALAGVVVGLLLAVLADTGSVTDAGGVLPFLGGSNGPRLLSALTGAVVGLGVGAGLALWADRRSLRR